MRYVLGPTIESAFANIVSLWSLSLLLSPLCLSSKEKCDLLSILVPDLITKTKLGSSGVEGNSNNNNNNNDDNDGDNDESSLN